MTVYARNVYARAVWATLAALVVTVLVPRPVGATVMVEVPLEEMIRDADVFDGAVDDRVGVRLVIDERGATPHTLTRIRVREWIKGGGGDRVSIDEIGGVMPQGGMRIAGTPEYHPGEEVIVFLRQVEAGLYRTFAMVQGRFEVIRGVPGVEDVVQRDTSAIGLASWARGPMAIEHGERRSMPLADFLEHVRAVLEQLAILGSPVGDRRLR